MSIILSENELKKLVEHLRGENKTIITTNGCFDIIHKGHVIYLKQAKKYADILIVGLNSDDSVRRLKGEDRPINDQNSRAIVLSELRSVDYVYIFDEDTPIKFLEIVKPDFHAKGADYLGKDIPELRVLDKFGGEMVYIDYIENSSTTSIIEKIKKRG